MSTAIKRSVEYIQDLSVGEWSIRLTENGKWTMSGVMEGMSKKDLALVRNLLQTLIDEQELAQ